MTQKNYQGTIPVNFLVACDTCGCTLVIKRTEWNGANNAYEIDVDSCAVCLEAKMEEGRDKIKAEDGTL